MRDISGNAIERESFGSDARNSKRCKTSSVDYCVPTAVEGVYIIRFGGFSSAVLDIMPKITYAVATDYGVEPDGVVAYWDTRTKTRVLRITISGSGAARDVYWNEGDGSGFTTNTDYLISWEEHEAEQS